MPSLAITNKLSNVFVSWPAEASSLSLESSADLNSGWANVVSAPTIDNTNVSVKVPTAKDVQFFRLKAPQP